MTIKRAHGAGPYARRCACPVPDGKRWCYRCNGTVHLTAEQARYLASRPQPIPPPAGGGEARPVAVA